LTELTQVQSSRGRDGGRVPRWWREAGAGAFGVSVNANGPGGATFTLGPIPSVDLPGEGGNVSTSAASASVPPVLSATVLNVSSQGANLGSHAGFSISTAQLGGADVLSGALTVEVLTATCTSNGDGSTGSTTLVNAQAGGNGLAVNPPPNTTMPVGTIALWSSTSRSSPTPGRRDQDLGQRHPHHADRGRLHRRRDHQSGPVSGRWRRCADPYRAGWPTGPGGDRAGRPSGSRS
jgi:hypothetical protein